MTELELPGVGDADTGRDDADDADDADGVGASAAVHAPPSSATVATTPANTIQDAVFDIFLPLVEWPVAATLTTTGRLWLR